MREISIHDQFSVTRPTEESVMGKLEGEKVNELVDKLRGRQVQILYMLIGGMTEVEIARDIGVSKQNISKNVQIIREKAKGMFEN